MEHSPDEAESVEVCQLDLQKFLKVPVNIYHDGQVSTVKDLIDYAAHVFGGAHFSPARKPEQERLERFQKLLSAPYPLELAMLQSIDGIVLRGFQSLETSQSLGGPGRKSCAPCFFNRDLQLEAMEAKEENYPGACFD
jgi:hypothetical protein